MYYLGRYKLGDWIPLSVQCTDASGDAVAPDSAPTVTVYDGDFASVVSGKAMPAKDVGNRTGMFEIEGRLASGFSEGVHHALFQWSAGSHDGAELKRFRVVGGGHQDGAYTAVQYYDRPQANHIVGHLDSGVLEFRKNPRAS
jgi:hypothetical protein